jgi:DNA-directed RNA polymerase specialized sigma24 family protein
MWQGPRELGRFASSPLSASAFADALYDVAGPLLGFVLRVTRNPVLAEEVVQEAVVRACGARTI